MKTICGVNYYTIDELVAITSYRKGTIYNLTAYGIIGKPFLGLQGSDYPSQGLYSESVLKEIERYRTLKLSGLSKNQILSQLTAERGTYEHQLQILEARG